MPDEPSIMIGPKVRDETLPLSHFETFYARGGLDPWGFATSAYEAAKYAATMEALPRERYAAAFEVGCSIGVLTERLAQRCDALLAVEPVESALNAARARNSGTAWVRFAPLFVPRDWPDEAFDLVVLSEVLDYLGAQDLERLAERLRATVRHGGDVVLVHWVGKKGPAPKPSEASEILLAATRDFLTPLRQTRNADYRLDCLRRMESVGNLS